MIQLSVFIYPISSATRSRSDRNNISRQIRANAQPPSEDSYSVTRTVDGLPYFLSITDTAGQEEYRGLWTDSTMKSDAFLLVYDITNPSSLQTLDYFMDFIKMEAEQRVEDNERLRKEFGPNPTGIQIGMPPPVKIVAGNKCDLKDGRAITSRDGLEYARLNGCGFMETSAREMVNIEETFACMCCATAVQSQCDTYLAWFRRLINKQYSFVASFKLADNIICRAHRSDLLRALGNLPIPRLFHR